MPSVGALDHRTRTRLSRGTVAIDARIDLHGMTQEAAHRRLHRFLEAARADGARMVLVITGKGSGGRRAEGPAAACSAGRCRSGSARRRSACSSRGITAPAPAMAARARSMSGSAG